MNQTTKTIAKKKLGEWGKYTVYIVDDRAVRNRAQYAQEFSNYGVNIGEKGLVTVNFPFIPFNEIWIARSVKLFERHFIINEALTYVRGVDRGLSGGAAYDAAIHHEQSSRMRTNKKRKAWHIQKPVKVPAEVYIKKYLTIKNHSDIVKVYLINGRVVRDIYQIDYVEGGHGYVYPWIPKDEIWIDSALDTREIPLIVLHEYTERTLMKQRKFPYVKAHNIASKIEFTYRGKSLSKKQASSLTTQIVFRMIRAHHIKLYK